MVGIWGIFAMIALACEIGHFDRTGEHSPDHIVACVILCMVWALAAFIKWAIVKTFGDRR